MVFAEILQRAHDKSQAGTELMGDIGEELEFELVHLVLLGGLEALHLPRIAPPEPEHQLRNHCNQEDGIEDICQDSTVERRTNHYLHTCGVPGVVVVIDGLHLKDIGAGRKAGKRCLAGFRTSVDPGVAKACHPVGVVDLARVDKVYRGKLERQRGLVVSQFYGAGTGHIMP